MRNGLIINSYGAQEWWLNDKRHRIDGPAIIHTDGYRAWWINDKRHRIDGPAIIWADGRQAWCINGEYHREDGPAVIYGYQIWYLNGNEISDAEIKEWQEKYNIPQDYKKWNKEHKMLFKLRFS